MAEAPEDIFVPIPGDRDGAAVHCRVPELSALAFAGLLPSPLLEAVVDAHPREADEPNWIVDDERPEAPFLDRWVVAVAIEPAVVLTRKEAGEDKVCVDDLGSLLKRAIHRATYPVIARRAAALGGAAAATFRDGVSLRAAA